MWLIALASLSFVWSLLFIPENKRAASEGGPYAAALANRFRESVNGAWATPRSVKIARM